MSAIAAPVTGATPLVDASASLAFALHPLDRTQRARIEAAIEMLLGILDAADGDPDAEPHLGALENHPYPAGFTFCSQEDWAAFLADDREADADFEPFAHQAEI